MFWGRRPGAELASHLNVGDGPVSEAGKGVLYIHGRDVYMWVGTWFALQQQNSQTQTENQTYFFRAKRVSN